VALDVLELLEDEERDALELLEEDELGLETVDLEELGLETVDLEELGLETVALEELERGGDDFLVSLCWLLRVVALEEVLPRS